MKLELRQKLAREPFEEKIRKVGQLIRLTKTFPRRLSRANPPVVPPNKHRLSAYSKQRNRILSYERVGRCKRQTVRLCLADQHAVEWIAMQPR
jgi:hypothetical protein